MRREDLQKVVEDFISGPPAILIIRGRWGAGKTYFWRQVLKGLKDSGKFSNPYAYVSLFGLDDLDQLKESIVISYLNPGESNPQSPARLWRSTKALGIDLWSKSSFLAKSLPLPSLSLAFHWVKDSLICFDDLERRGGNLDLKNFLGIASMLRDERNCKVALILNDQALDEKQREELRQASEKMVDIVLDFSPTSEEIFKIGFPEATSYREIFYQRVRDIKTSNIRTVKRIHRLWQQLEPLLKTCEHETAEEVIHSLVLFAWSHYEGGQIAPPLDYIRGFTPFSKENATPQERQWDLILQEYGFRFTHELDQALATYVERGFIDPDRLPRLIEARNAEIKASGARAAFSSIWEIYRNSFDNNEESLLEELRRLFREHISHINIGELDQVIQLTRELGKDELAAQLVHDYLGAHGELAFDADSYPFQLDQHLSDQLREQALRLRPPKSFKEAVRQVALNNSWMPEDIDIMASATPEDYYRLFKGEHSESLRKIVISCLNFGDSTNPRHKSIRDSTKAALVRIAQESGLNKIRVSRLYKLSLEENGGETNLTENE